MRIPYEKDLREQLVQQLDLIEPGLRLVKTEYLVRDDLEGTAWLGQQPGSRLVPRSPWLPFDPG